jgi:hypothetical protein
VEPLPPPPSDAAACLTYKEAGSSISQIRDAVLSGDFTIAGKAVLVISPRLELARLRLVESSRTSDDFDVASADLVVRLNQLNVMLGQAIKGELGRTVITQITLMKEVEEVEALHARCLKCLMTRKEK